MNPEALRALVAGSISQPDLLRLFEYWLERCKGGTLPARRDIDPLDLPYIIGNLILVDVEREPYLRFRYRLTGSHLTTQMRLSLTGTLVEDHPDPTFRALVNAVYTQVATSTQPLAYRRDEIVDRRVRRYDVLILPLASDGHTVDMILAAMK